MAAARIRSLVARGSALATDRRVRRMAQLLLLIGLVSVLLRLRGIWHDSRFSLAHVSWPLLLAAALLSALGVASTGAVWLSILRQFGVRTERWFAGIFFQAQLSKYIPGSVWQYAGRATVSRAHGLPGRAVALSLPIELLVSLLAAGLASLLLLGTWGAAAAAAVFAGLVLCAAAPAERAVVRVLHRLIPGRQPEAVVRASIRAIGSYGGIWFVLGFGFWLTARALFGVPLGDFPTYFGAFAAAWVLGLIAVYAPGGIGVREALLVALLRGKLGAADALVLAAVSRAVLTVVDVAAAGVGVLLVRGGASRLSLASSAGDADSGSSA